MQSQDQRSGWEAQSKEGHGVILGRNSQAGEGAMYTYWTEEGRKKAAEAEHPTVS